MFDRKPRLEAEKITKKETPEKFIGKKSIAVLQQEYFSLLNVKEPFRIESWLNSYHKVVKQILSLDDGANALSSFKSKYGYLGRIPPDE